MISAEVPVKSTPKRTYPSKGWGKGAKGRGSVSKGGHTASYRGHSYASYHKVPPRMPSARVANGLGAQIVGGSSVQNPLVEIFNLTSKDAWNVKDFSKFLDCDNLTQPTKYINPNSTFCESFSSDGEYNATVHANILTAVDMSSRMQTNSIVKMIIQQRRDIIERITGNFLADYFTVKHFPHDSHLINLLAKSWQDILDELKQFASLSWNKRKFEDIMSEMFNSQYFNYRKIGIAPKPIIFLDLVKYGYLIF